MVQFTKKERLTNSQFLSAIDVQPDVVVYDDGAISIKGADGGALNLWFWGAHQAFFKR